MLPRLRFVIAALAIALVPWMLLGTVMRSHEAATPMEMPHAHGTLLQQAKMAGNETRQFQALAYARRSEELERLRELASAPLPNWLAAPVGDKAPDATALDKEPEPPATADSAPADAPLPDPLPQASLEHVPAAAATSSDPLPAVVEVPPPVPEDAAPLADPQAEVATAAISLDPPAAIPLPQARPAQKRRASAARSRRRLASGSGAYRTLRGVSSPDPNPFSGLFNLP